MDKTKSFLVVLTLLFLNFLILGSDRCRYVMSMSRRNVLYNENMDTSKMTTAQFKKWQAAMRARRQRQKLKMLKEKRFTYFNLSFKPCI